MTKTSRIRKHKGIMSYTKQQQAENRKWFASNVLPSPHVQSPRPKWQIMARIKAAIARAARKVSRPTY